jgi:hypothetical protein
MASDAIDGPESVDALLEAGFSDPDEALFILSEGFDPRCLWALRRFIEVVGAPRVLAIDPQPPDATSEITTATHRQQHSAELRKMAGDRLTRMPYPDVHDPSSVGRILAQQITDSSILDGVRSVAFDISAFPTSLSFPPIRAMLDAALESWGPDNLQVLVTANPDLDQRIVKSSLGPAHMLAGFRGPQRSGQVNVWAPVLGLRGTGTLGAIADFIDPQEVCPILPFPAQDPRLPDRILASHRELLIDQFEIGPNNLIYAAESNPFDLYRTLARFYSDYTTTLEPLGGALVHVSVHGSKLLSVGALLAAYEFDLPVVAMRANHYVLSEQAYEEETRSADQVTCLWLRGDPYVAS